MFKKVQDEIQHHHCMALHDTYMAHSCIFVQAAQVLGAPRESESNLPV